MTTKPVVGQRLFDSGTVASEELRTQLQRARVTLDFVADAIVSTDLNGQVDFINDAAERLLGRTMSAARGRGIDELFSLHSVETHAALANPIHRCLDHGRPIERSGGSLLSVAGQTPVLVRERVVPVRDDSGRVLGAVLVLHDLSRESGLSEQLNWRQQHDALTGLLNREEFERRLQFEVERLRGGTVSSTLLYLDIDRFRVINDTAGHLAGDRLLIEVARRVQEQIRGSDLCARFGDDEFAVLLRDCDARNALAIANQLRNDFEIHRFGWRSRVFRYTGSIGLVQIEPGMDCGTVLAAADVACFAAKDAGRNAVTLYSA
ncbi:MAG: diguanylate cyclase, partial [Gammaproteobacteria bacterium]|nr:diguanylate cyclase [Gammaproteobacteria bacterium]